MKTAKSLAVLQGGIRVGSASLADFTENDKGVRIKTHDGDTVNVRLSDRFGLRFLGIDTPEVSMMLPGGTRFKSLSNVGWDTLFTSGNWKKGMNLSSALLADLEKRAGDGTGVAANHARYARKAKISLEEIISQDIRASGVSADKFGLFMSFGLEFLDGYGRLLCYLNSGRENFSDPVTARAVTRWSYNERQLLAGWALPYFIWPNVQPFLNKRPFDEENARPDGFWKIIRAAGKLQDARSNVAEARTQGAGIYNPADPLRIMPFELRLISRGKAPDRYVIDLANPGSAEILHPEDYYSIACPEDRLYVPSEYVSVFKLAGWKIKK